MNVASSPPEHRPLHAQAWRERYGQKHQLVRVNEQTAGFSLPKRVRIYRRREHYILQWWDRAAGRNLNQRVDGDLITAVAKARDIDEKLSTSRGSGKGGRRIGIMELIELFLSDL